jgi:hypothetical protein
VNWKENFNMSLINDALKRATSLRKKETAAERVPLEPVAASAPSSGNGLKIVLAAILVLGLGYAGWSWRQGRNPQTPAVAKNGKTSATNKVAAPGTTKARTVSTGARSTNNNPLARAAAIATSLKKANDDGSSMAESIPGKAPEPVVQASGQPKAGNASSTPAAQSLARTKNNTALAAQSATPDLDKQTASAVEFPDLKVQGIFFRVKGPVAVIDGKSIREGEEVNGVKVAQITRDEIRLEYQGQSKTISLK